MLDRITRIIKLDFPVFKDIESDPNATTEAAIVVTAASVLSAIGSAAGSSKPFLAFISGVLSGVIGWVVWSYVSYLVGRALYQSKGELPGVLRVVGYANAPQLLGILKIIPCVGWIGALVGAILSLIAGIMAIREGLDLEVGQAIIVAVVGWIALAIVSAIIAVIFGVGAAFTALLFGGLQR
jgi:hypothetical protein